MTEIVACIINGRVTASLGDVIAAARLDIPMRPIDRRVAQLMAACDLGPQWKALAEAPALFETDTDGSLKLAVLR